MNRLVHTVPDPGIFSVRALASAAPAPSAPVHLTGSGNKAHNKLFFKMCFLPIYPTVVLQIHEVTLLMKCWLMLMLYWCEKIGSDAIDIWCWEVKSFKEGALLKLRETGHAEAWLKVLLADALESLDCAKRFAQFLWLKSFHHTLCF